MSHARLRLKYFNVAFVQSELEVKISANEGCVLQDKSNSVLIVIIPALLIGVAQFSRRQHFRLISEPSNHSKSDSFFRL